MVYPNPGEVVLTDPTTGKLVTEEHDDVSLREHYVACTPDAGEVGERAPVRMYYPMHRVVAVRRSTEMEAGYGGERDV